MMIHDCVQLSKVVTHHAMFLPCSRQYSSQHALPIWAPAWPMWTEMHSLCSEQFISGQTIYCFKVSQESREFRVTLRVKDHKDCVFRKAIKQDVDINRHKIDNRYLHLLTMVNLRRVLDWAWQWAGARAAVC